mmetsp:Transcript_103885/g.290926  ORF Transcript_103885/g.290926 Transcript_103885/m.290926 type:complete len:215 (-) Transcript_103885:234-878(-)
MQGLANRRGPNDDGVVDATSDHFVAVCEDLGDIDELLSTKDAPFFPSGRHPLGRPIEAPRQHTLARREHLDMSVQACVEDAQPGAGIRIPDVASAVVAATDDAVALGEDPRALDDAAVREVAEHLAARCVPDEGPAVAAPSEGPVAEGEEAQARDPGAVPPQRAPRAVGPPEGDKGTGAARSHLVAERRELEHSVHHLPIEVPAHAMEHDFGWR